MDRTDLRTNGALAFVIAGLLAAGPAIADKPPWAGAGKGGKGEQGQRPENSKSGQRDADERSRRDSGRSAVPARDYFGDRHRTIVRDYYGEQFRRGRCPPGLAKKQNGCMPPGQARKWAHGQQLPRDVIFHDLPPALAGQFGRPPSGHRYVRVDSDVLLITLGTGLVVDAIRNLGRS